MAVSDIGAYVFSRWILKRRKVENLTVAIPRPESRCRTGSQND